MGDVMKFVTNIDKKKYDSFVKKNKKSHFLQSYAWGEFRSTLGFTSHFVGLTDDNDNLVCTALLIEKHLPFGLSYLYSPRGFVIDFQDKALLEEFTNHIKEFAKTRKAIFIKIDPDIVIKKYNYLDEEQELDYNPDEIFNNITSLGFNHLGFTKNFETMEPRYTFRIDLTQNIYDIESKFSKTTMQRIKKGEDLGVKVRIGTIDDIESFYKLMELTESRKDFVSHDLNYYKKLYEIYNKDNKANIFLGSIDCDYIIDKYKTDLTRVELELNPLKEEENPSKSAKVKINELEKRVTKLNEQIDEYSKYKEEYGNEIILSAHFIIEYADKAWVLYAGNHNILSQSYANYKTYYEHLKYCKDNDIRIYDQFGTIGDLSEDNPRYGLHMFKKKFGGDYLEFIGEFDLVTNKFMYFIFTKLVPIYRNIIRNISKKKINKNTGGK